MGVDKIFKENDIKNLNRRISELDSTKELRKNKKRIEKYINYKRAKKVEVEFDSIGDVSIDGELVNVKKFTAEIVEKAIRFVIPASLAANKINGGEKELVH